MHIKTPRRHEPGTPRVVPLLGKPHLRWRGSVASKSEGTRFVLRVPLLVAILGTFEVSFFVL
jgi:hypothetical protein